MLLEQAAEHGFTPERLADDLADRIVDDIGCLPWLLHRRPGAPPEAAWDALNRMREAFYELRELLDEPDGPPEPWEFLGE